MSPIAMEAKNYKTGLVGYENPNLPIKAPARYWVAFDLDEETGDFVIMPNYDITGLAVTLTSNGVTYLNTTVSLTAGQTYTDSLDFLDEGTYTLTLSTADGTIAQYIITVEDD